MSIALWRLLNPNTEYNLLFVPANWDGKADPKGRWPAFADGDVALDLQAGGHGIKGHPSAFSHVLMTFGTAELIQQLAWIGRYVDAVDQGQRSGGEFITLNHTINALGKVMTSAGMIDFCMTFMRGHIIIQQGKAEAEAMANAASWPTPGLAVRCDSGNGAVNALLFERGARVIVFQTPDSVGVLRRSGDPLNLAEGPLVEFLRSTGEPIQPPTGGVGWFIHPDGFLVTSRSTKAEATFVTKITAAQLAEVLRTML